MVVRPGDVVLLGKGYGGCHFEAEWNYIVERGFTNVCEDRIPYSAQFFIVAKDILLSGPVAFHVLCFPKNVLISGSWIVKGEHRAVYLM